MGEFGDCVWYLCGFECGGVILIRLVNPKVSTRLSRCTGRINQLPSDKGVILDRVIVPYSLHILR